MMQERLKLKGRYLIIVQDTNGRELMRYNLDNQLTDLYANAIKDNLSGGTLQSLAIKYFDFGNGTTEATKEDTSLENPLVRVPIVSSQIKGDYVETTCVLLPADLPSTRIREIGVFCGANATATIGTGLMISRINVDIQKTESEQIIFIRKDYVTI